MASQKPALPLEIWGTIMQDCSTTELKTLALVSKGLCNEARHHLYQDVFYDNGLADGEVHPFYTGAEPLVWQTGRTRIRDLLAFNRTLSRSEFWKDIVRCASLTWVSDNIVAPGSGGVCRRPPGDESRLKEKRVARTATLLSDSKALVSLYLDAPSSGSPVFSKPPAVHIILTRPLLSDYRHPPKWDQLLKLFQIPTLRQLNLECMFRLNCAVPTEFHQAGCSNLTHLTLTNSGPLRKELSDVLSWPKKLKRLEIVQDTLYSSAPWSAEAGPLDNDDALKALHPLEESLEELRIGLGDLEYADNSWDPDFPKPASEPGFRNFKSLRKLRVPLHMLMLLTEVREPGEPPRRLPMPRGYTQLPRCLEELDLDVERDGHLTCRVEELDDELKSKVNMMDVVEVPVPEEGEDYVEKGTLSGSAHELFEWLSRFLPHRDEYLPELRQITIHHHATAFNRALAGPTGSRFVESFREKGITIKKVNSGKLSALDLADMEAGERSLSDYDLGPQDFEDDT